MIGRENVAERGTVGAVIVALHIGIVALLATSGFMRAAPVAPAAEVTFIQETERPLERPPVDTPILTPVHQALIPPPEVQVAVEPDSTAIAATVVEAPPAPQPVAPSDTGTAVPEMSDVAYLVQPAPHYPPESRRIHEQGLVVLRVLIDESGHAKAVEIYRSSGHPRLDEAARNAVAHAVFKPFLNGGVAHAAAAIVPIEFSLRSSSS